MKKPYNILYLGNCLEVMKGMEDNSVDSIVTDPPYGLSFMGKKRDYDVPSTEIRKEALRVLKPGGHLLSFAGTRTQHRMAVNIEDAGFEIRDMIAWVYGSGFPKSHNIGKSVDKIEGNKRKNVEKIYADGSKPRVTSKYVLAGEDLSNTSGIHNIETKGNSQREGRGSALKPALEPITFARKPLGEKTIAKNVLKHGTGGINIDGCRVEIPTNDPNDRTGEELQGSKDEGFLGFSNNKKRGAFKQGRFPANFIHDGSDEVVDLFPITKSGGSNGKRKKGPYSNNRTWNVSKTEGVNVSNGLEASAGSAARFFYCAKCSKKDRNEGLDGHKIITIMGIVLPTKDNLGNTEQPDQKAIHLLDIELYQKNDTGEYTIELRKGLGLNMGLFEKINTEKFQNECKSIIETEGNGIIVLKIWNSLRHFITKGYIADVNGGIEFGESHVESVEGGKLLTTTIKGQVEYLLDASDVVSQMQLKIKERENKNSHSTVKPTKLMQYLVRLVTPKNGIVLDPFMGSGSTGKACMLEGFNFIGIDMEQEYIDIARARIENAA